MKHDQFNPIPTKVLFVDIALHIIGTKSSM